MMEENIRKYALLMEELGLTGLEITEDNQMVRLERNVSNRAAEIIPMKPLALETLEGTERTNDLTIKSPLVGIFYAAPTETSEAYVSIGDYIEKGKTLGIIEAMKLMNEVIAEESGILTDICVTNGQVVEYGTELFRIKR